MGYWVDLSRHIRLCAHFESCSSLPTIHILTTLGLQAALTAAHIVAQQNFNVPQLGASFLPLDYYLAGTVPQPDNPMASLVNGFSLKCEHHLMYEDRTVADPVFPPECSCGMWVFHLARPSTVEAPKVFTTLPRCRFWAHVFTVDVHGGLKGRAIFRWQGILLHCLPMGRCSRCGSLCDLCDT